MNAVVYARLSRKGEDTDLQRQVRLCRQRADREGWTVVAEHVDNGTSAWKPGVKRPAYEEMLGNLGDAEVLVYNTDRLFRQDRERLRFFDAYVAAGLTVVRVVDGNDIDLTTADGRFAFQSVGAAAEHQSARMSERIRRKMEELSQEGHRWGGRRPFGYQRDMKMDRREAKAIRQGADMVLAGASAWHVARAWNEQGVTTPTGRRWSIAQVQTVLSSAMIAGIREHRRDGAVLGTYKGTWDGIVTPDEHEALVALLAPRKRAGGELTRKHPLTSILRCGECGSPLFGRTQPDGRRSYACPSSHGGCGKVAVGANAAEDVVIDAVHAADVSYGRKRKQRAAVDVVALRRVAEKRSTLRAAGDIGANVRDLLAQLDDEERALRSEAEGGTPTDPNDAERRDRRHVGELTETEVAQTHDWVAAWVDHVDVRRATSTREPARDRLTISWR